MAVVRMVDVPVDDIVGMVVVRYRKMDAADIVLVIGLMTLRIVVRLFASPVHDEPLSDVACQQCAISLACRG